MLVTSDLQKSGTYLLLALRWEAWQLPFVKIIKIPVLLASFVLVKHRLIQEIDGQVFQALG